MRRRPFLHVCLTAGIVALEPTCQRGSNATVRLLMLHAGSLAIPLREVAAAFVRLHPGLTIEREAAGSRESARKISDLGRACDVFAAADYEVVETLLMPDHATFNLAFATNEMVLAFRRHSRAANRITNQNWHHVLLEEETVVGRANPEHDPCGYRTEMVFQLAERHYARPGLAASLAAKAGPRTMRPKETDLLALLEAKELDYIFIYRSVAAQHGLMQVSLPARIHLGSPEHAAYYRQASVQVTGKRPGERITLHGIPIAYSVTIPKAAPNPAVAEAFVALLLSPEGQSILERCGQRPLRPAVTKEFDRLPASLRPLCSRWV